MPRIPRRLALAVPAAALVAVVYVTVGAATVKSTPVATSSPTISGTAQQGQTLTVSPGSWSGTQPITYSYQWQRCDSGGCTIVGSSQSYVLQSADVGHTMVAVVTATNSEGSGQAASSPTSTVTTGSSQGPGPVNVKAPVVSGTLAVGQKLSVSAGTWTGASPITFRYEWQRCDSNGQNCQGVSGGNSSQYTLTQADQGRRMQVKVYARNSAGENAKYSNQTNPVGGGTNGPENKAAPQIVGTTATGQKLTVTPGTWVGVAPITFAYEWQRCDAQGQNCAPIPNATANTYTPTTADAGRRLQVKVTASNSGGATQKYSNQTGPVANVGGQPAPSGGGTIAASAVKLPNRLTVDKIQYPQGGHSRSPFTARFHVVDGSGRSVQGALVYVVGLPYHWIRAVPEQATDATGWVNLTINPTTRMPKRTALVMFVRARTPEGDLLAGASTRRLVQVRVR